MLSDITTPSWITPDIVIAWSDEVKSELPYAVLFTLVPESNGSCSVETEQKSPVVKASKEDVVPSGHMQFRPSLTTPPALAQLDSRAVEFIRCGNF
jgi:hypothetical protein